MEISPGVFTSSLIAAKSKLAKGTIPRNELTAIMLSTELAFIIKRALGPRVKEVIYLPDSMIAFSWCSSLGKKVRLFVQNRVMTILRMVQWTLGWADGDPLPLYHVDVSTGSLWQSGPSWLSLPVDSMPTREVCSDVSETRRQEGGTDRVFLRTIYDV